MVVSVSSLLVVTSGRSVGLGECGVHSRERERGGSALLRRRAASPCWLAGVLRARLLLLAAEAADDKLLLRACSGEAALTD